MHRLREEAFNPNPNPNAGSARFMLSLEPMGLSLTLTLALVLAITPMGAMNRSKRPRTKSRLSPTKPRHSP